MIVDAEAPTGTEGGGVDGAEVGHLAGGPEKCVGGAVGKVSNTCCLALVVDGITLAPQAAQSSQVAQLSVASDKSEEIAVGIVGCSDNLTRVVYALRAVPPLGIVRAESSEVGHVAIRVEERVDLPIGEIGCTDDLSDIVDGVAVG